MTIFSKKEQCRVLANLMRAGAKKAPQTFSGAICVIISPENYSTCALGAVADELGFFNFNTKDQSNAYGLLKDHFPVLTETVYHRDIYWPLQMHIESMNDADHKSREEIADWVESLEWYD